MQSRASMDPNNPFAAFLASRPASPKGQHEPGKGSFRGLTIGAPTELQGLHDGPAYGMEPGMDPFSSFLATRPAHPTKEAEILRAEVLRTKQSLLQVSLDAELKAKKGELPAEAAERVLRLRAAQRYLEHPERIGEPFSAAGSAASEAGEVELPAAAEQDVSSARDLPSLAAAGSAADLNGSVNGSREGSRSGTPGDARPGLSASMRMSTTLKSTGALAMASTGMPLEEKDPLLSGWYSKRRSFNLQISTCSQHCSRNSAAVPGGCLVMGNGRMPFFRGSHLLSKGYYYAFKIEQADANPPVGASLGCSLAVGVSRVPQNHSSMQGARCPLYAYEVPGAVAVGYGQNYISEGKWYKAPWDSNGVSVGDKVGVVITPEGDFVLFINDVQVMRTTTTLVSDPSKTGRQSFFPLVDLCGRVSGLKLLPLAEIPNVPLKLQKGLERVLIK